MGVTLTDVLLFGKAQLADVDKATLVIYRRNILRWSALGGYLDIIVKGVAPLSLPDAIANSLSYVKAFGGTEQNGTPTPDAPIDIVCNNGVLKVNSQGQIYTDGTVETINAHGKNLFDPTKVLFGYYRDRTTGDKTQNSSNFMSSDDGYIPCLPNTTYTFVGTKKIGGTYSKYNTIYFFDSAKNYLGASPYEVSQPTTGTTPNNCYYLQVRSNPLDNSTPIQDAFAQFNWQLEQGSTVTAYQPYYNGGTATAEMLLKVGDYQDVQSIIDGVVTRNIRILVLTGDESWTRQSPPSGKTFYTYNLSLGSYSGVGELPNVPYCTHLQRATATGRGNIPDNGIGVSANTPYTTLWFRCDTYESITDWTNFLKAQYNAGTPVILVYPLATPTTESVAGQTLQVVDGDNTLAITQAGLTGLELEAEYQAAVSLTIQEVQDANLDPNVQVTIN